MNSPEIGTIYRQIVQIFGQKGWQLGVGDAVISPGTYYSHSGIVIQTWTGDETTPQAQCVMDAFSEAKVEFDRLRGPARPPMAPPLHNLHPPLEITFTSAIGGS